MNKDTNHLFVYGTLRKGSQHIMSRLLVKHARPLGDAQVRGRLYDLSEYPAAVNQGEPGDLIHGELYELIDPENCMPMLDEYEGCAPSSAFPHLFEREIASVTLTGGGTRHEAWVYWYRGNFDERQRIAHGDYIKFLNSEIVEE